MLNRSLLAVLRAEPDENVAHATFSVGCSLRSNCNSSALIPAAVEATRGADVVVFAMGLLSCDRAGENAWPAAWPSV